MNSLLLGIVEELDEKDLVDFPEVVQSYIQYRAFRFSLAPDLLAEACYMCPISRRLFGCPKMFDAGGCYVVNDLAGGSTICRVTDHNYRCGQNQPMIEHPTDSGKSLDIRVGTDTYCLCCNHPFIYAFNVCNLHVFKGHIISHHLCYGSSDNQKPAHGSVSIIKLVDPDDGDSWIHHVIPAARISGTYRSDHYHQRLYYICSHTVSEVTDITDINDITGITDITDITDIESNDILTLVPTKVRIIDDWRKDPYIKITIHRGVLCINQEDKVSFYDLLGTEDPNVIPTRSAITAYGCYYLRVTELEHKNYIEVRHAYEGLILELDYYGHAKPTLGPGYLSVRDKHYDLDKCLQVTTVPQPQ